jgi:hypothetical protein
MSEPMPDELSDAEFLERHRGIFYKTSGSKVGSGGDANQGKPNSKEGLNGKFTSHLIECGMFRNNSLNTTADRERFMNGSKDWMDNLS